MPRIDRAIGKCNISGFDGSSSIVVVCRFDRVKDLRGVDVKDKATYFSERGERDLIAKRLVGGVCRLKVAEFCTCLIVPLSTCVCVCV